MLDCAYCLRAKNDESLDLAVLAKVLPQAKVLNYGEIGLTGGEPCLHPGFEELLHMITDHGFQFTVVSNGWNTAPYRQAFQKYGKKRFARITFSLDSVTPEVHDRLRHPGSHAKVMENIRWFRSRMPVAMTAILTPLNMGEIEALAQFAESAGLCQCNFSAVIPTDTNAALRLNEEQRQTCCRRVHALVKRTLFPIRRLSGLGVFEQADFCCALSGTSFAVNVKGEGIFCCDTAGDGAVLGSLKRAKLRTLLGRVKEVSTFLKKARIQHYVRNEFFSGFDTCAFCDMYLTQSVRHTGRGRTTTDRTARRGRTEGDGAVVSPTSATSGRKRP
jgi:MoaA/NifB/PqqE/SkfB family radical SAM enzyme